MTNRSSFFILFVAIFFLTGCIKPSLYFPEGGTKKMSGSFHIKAEGIKRGGTFVTKYNVRTNGTDHIEGGKSYFYSSMGPRLLTLTETPDSVTLDPRGEEPFTLTSSILLNLGEGFPFIPLTYSTFLRTMKGKLPIEVESVLSEKGSNSFTTPVKNSKYVWDVLISRRGDRIENITLSLADDYTIVFRRPGPGFFYEIEYNSKNSDYIKIRYDS